MVLNNKSQTSVPPTGQLNRVDALSYDNTCSNSAHWPRHRVNAVQPGMQCFVLTETGSCFYDPNRLVTVLAPAGDFWIIYNMILASASRSVHQSEGVTRQDHVNGWLSSDRALLVKDKAPSVADGWDMRPEHTRQRGLMWCWRAVVNATAAAPTFSSVSILCFNSRFSVRSRYKKKAAKVSLNWSKPHSTFFLAEPIDLYTPLSQLAPPSL